jgi:hypothetical protein
MERGAGGSSCDLWLWDGATEYEGMLVKLEGAAFSARVRQARRVSPVLGKRAPLSYLEAQRVFARKKFLAHVKGAVEGTLFELEVDSVQGSSDGEFDYLLSGHFGALEEKQLETLRKLPLQGAAALLGKRVS